MRYRLIVLTHGDCAPLEATLASFAAHVTPAPESCVLVYDGPELYGALSPHPNLSAVETEIPWTIATMPEGRQGGFCAATRRAWSFGGGENALSHQEHDHVFYLEHDFLFLRRVDLRDLAAPLDSNKRLAQMALMRDAVSEEEHAAGGLFELRRSGYQQLASFLPGPSGAPVEYLEHTAYLTTNPSLMRRDWMADHPWPDYPQQCEGRFGIDLVADGWRFGAWGEGEPWVRHAGVRTGFGY